MSSANLARPQKTIRRRNKVASESNPPPFRIIELETLAENLDSEQYAAVQAYRNVLVESALHHGIDVDEMTIAFSDQWDAWEDIVFALYVFAQADAAMLFWEQVDEAREAWLLT